MYYPSYRMRRLRRTPAMRDMVRETTLRVDDLICPLFVTAGENIRRPVASMPGCFQLSIGSLLAEVREVARLGIPAVLLFGIPSHKDSAATGAYDAEGVIQMAVRAIKDELPDLLVITDVCLCEYMDHGQCGVVQDGEIVNDVTIELLTKMAVTHAESGADVVAPSDMMDGRVAAIRNALDDEGLIDTAIMSASAKFASAFYAPFDAAVHSGPVLGDRRTYQLDCANGEEAVREVLLDIEEGADIVMVKPALSVSRYRADGEAGDEVPAGRLLRERRVRDDQGGGRERLARRTDSRHGGSHGDQASGRRSHRDLPRRGYRPLALLAAQRRAVVSVRSVSPAGSTRPPALHRRRSSGPVHCRRSCSRRSRRTRRPA